jgi:hypothetical protein
MQRVFSVFFRGFRGHDIDHQQVEIASGLLRNTCVVGWRLNPVAYMAGDVL